MSSFIAYIGFMPILEYLNSIIGNDLHTGFFLTFLHFALIFAFGDQHESFSYVTKNFSDAVSSFLMLLSITHKAEYSLHVMIMSCVVKFSNMQQGEYKFYSNEYITEFITFVTYGCTYYFDSTMVAFMYVMCLVAHTLYSSTHIVADINKFTNFFQLGFEISNTDTNKHLAVWTIIKMWYIYHNLFSTEHKQDITLSSFNIVMGIIFLVNIIKNILSSEIISIFSDKIEISFFVLAGIFLICIEPMIALKITMFVSFIFYTYFCDYKLPQNATGLLFVFNTLFLWVLFCNITRK
jgi:hypothetical protein